MEGLSYTIPEPPPFSFLGTEKVDLCPDDYDEISDEGQAHLDRLTDPNKKKRKPWHSLTDEEYAEKIPGCGTYSGRSANIYSGVIQAVCWHCRCWQTRGEVRCEHCFERRMQAFKQKLKDAYEKCSSLYLLKLPHDKMTDIIHRLKLNKSQFLRFPTKNEDGTVMDFLVTRMNDIKRVIQSEPLHGYEFGRINLDVIADTPMGYRTSGSLGSRKIVTARIFIATAHIDPSKVTAEMETKALFKAEQATLGANPKTHKEVEDCINKKIEAYASSIRMQGGKVNVKYVHKPCRISYISWTILTEVKMSDMALRALSFPRNKTQNHGDEAFAALQGDSTVIH